MTSTASPAQDEEHTVIVYPKVAPPPQFGLTDMEAQDLEARKVVVFLLHRPPVSGFLFFVSISDKRLFCSCLLACFLFALFQKEVRMQNEKYLRSHPELAKLLQDFTMSVLDNQPKASRLLFLYILLEFPSPFVLHVPHTTARVVLCVLLSEVTHILFDAST